MNLQQAKGFVELMKDIDSRNNLNESSKSLLPYMKWLVERVEQLEFERQNDKECISKMSKRIKAFEEKYLYPQ